MTEVLWLFAIQGLLGAFDTIYFHEWRARLPALGLQSRPELRLYLTTEPPAMLGPVVTLLAARSAELTDVHIGQPTLEDVFIELTGKGLR